MAGTGRGATSWQSGCRAALQQVAVIKTNGHQAPRESQGCYASLAFGPVPALPSMTLLSGRREALPLSGPQFPALENEGIG